MYAKWAENINLLYAQNFHKYCRDIGENMLILNRCHADGFDIFGETDTFLILNGCHLDGFDIFRGNQHLSGMRVDNNTFLGWELSQEPLKHHCDGGSTLTPSSN